MKRGSWLPFIAWVVTLIPIVGLGFAVFQYSMSAGLLVAIGGIWSSYFIVIPTVQRWLDSRRNSTST